MKNESINECTGTFRVCSSYDRLWKFRQKGVKLDPDNPVSLTV